MSLLKIEHLRKVYDDVIPLTDVSLEVEEGEVISIIGPSGTGKSTLLRCINQLASPTSGTVIFDGEIITDPDCDIAKVRRKMGMVFQQFNLFANRNIIDNIIAAPMKLLKKPRDEAYIEGMDLLERIGLGDKAERYPDELSGGQQQRVAIARAVAMKPKILLFDEPTSALDPTMVAEVLGLIRALGREGMTMLIVTHEMRFARDVSTRVLYMDEGGIYEDGTPEEIFEHPRREKTRRFIQRLRTMEKEIGSSKDFDFLGTLTDIEGFGRENALPPIKIRNLQLAYEETMQIIAPHLNESNSGYPIRMVVEYAEGDGRISVGIRYGGDRFDPLKNGDELPGKLIKGIAARVEHRFDEEENRLEIEL